MPDYAHNIAASWNRAGLADPPAKLQYSVIDSGGNTLIGWTSNALTEPVPRQYRAEGVLWEGTVDVNVYWKDDLGRTAQEVWNSGTGLPADAPTPTPSLSVTGVLDQPLTSVVSKVLKLLGQSATLSATTTIYNPRTGIKTSTTQQWSVNASPPEDVGAHEVNGTTILTGDFRTVIPAVGFVGGPPQIPKVGMTLTWQGQVCDIVNVKKYWTGARAAGFELLCRGGL